jgi:hypothetical protein
MIKQGINAFEFTRFYGRFEQIDFSLHAKGYNFPFSSTKNFLSQ